MKLSVSLAEKDVEFLDKYASDYALASRSAALQAAIKSLRSHELVAAYRDAMLEWQGSEDQALWDTTTGDGIEPGETW